jgi:thiamine pyrophosphate-dependent acetolactate synthase large subunit-like protein
VSSLIATILARHVSHCFGVMGNGNAYLLNALLHTPVSYVAVRHEVGAVVAADAYFRTSGRIAVATATYGPGFTNTLTGLAEAVQAQTPLLLIVGDQPTSGPRPWDVDQIRIADGLAAPTYTVAAENVAATTVQALQHALDHRTAVVLAIPYDLVAAEVPEQQVPELIMPVRPAPDVVPISDAAALLRAAERPVILAGRGAWLADAGAALSELAARVGALTTTSAAGRNAFGPAPDGIDADLGICGGFADDEAATLIASADVVLVAGARLNLFTMRHQAAFAADAQVIQIDLAEAPTHPCVGHYIRGDVRLAAQALLAELDDPRPDLRQAQGAGVAQGTSAWRMRARDHRPRPHPGTGQAPDGRLDPRSVAYRLNEILPADRTVVSDGGHFIGWAATYWDIPAPNRLIMVGTHFQSIGLGLPSAVGAGAALPETTIVLTTGDGGALMGLADLDTMIRTVRRGVIVVWNDGYYGAELHQYGSLGLDDRPMQIPQVDFAALGRAMGAEAAEITTIDDLGRLQDWLTKEVDGLFVADCRISPAVRAPYMSTQLALTRR